VKAWRGKTLTEILPESAGERHVKYRREITPYSRERVAGALTRHENFRKEDNFEGREREICYIRRGEITFRTIKYARTEKRTGGQREKIPLHSTLKIKDNPIGRGGNFKGKR